MKPQIFGAAALLAALILPQSAKADWHGHVWWGPRYYHRSTIYVTPPPVVVEGGYYHRRVYEGHSGSVEMDVQAALRRRGYYHGPIDGDIGPGTRSAIRAYQADHDMRVTGTINNALLDRLGL